MASLDVRVVLTGSVFLLVAFAGCIDTGEPSGTDSAGPGGASVSFASDRGAVQGLVQDDALIPIEGASVGIRETKAETKTDRSGQYAFSDVEPGSYTIDVAKIGYKAEARKVDVRAGEVARLNVLLIPVPTGENVRHVTIIQEGYMACAVHALVVTVSNLNICPWDANHKPQIDFDVNKADNPQAIVLELTWKQASFATGNEIAYGLWKDPGCQPSPCESENQIDGVEGKSPLKLVVFESKFGKKMNAEGATKLSALTFVGSEAPVVVMYQQKVTHYITVFYNGEPEDDFTAIPSD